MRQKQTIKQFSRLGITFFLMLSLALPATAEDTMVLTGGNFRVVVPTNVDAPVKRAATALLDDFLRMTNSKPEQVSTPKGTGIDIIVVQDNKEGAQELLLSKRDLDDFESHRVYADPENHRIYLYGKDMRGTIYAIYTFSEEVLGVPPYYYYCSFNPVKQASISVPATLDIFYPSPEVRYRTWFPNDQDCWGPFLNSEERRGKWLEALLRMKMNTVEHGSTVDMKNKTLNSDARRLGDYGIVLTNHHMIFLNNDWGKWDSYWKDIRGYSTPPARSTKNFELMKEFFAYSIDCTLNSNVENLWQIACRGINDHPFWEYIDDSPSSSQERGAFITKVVNAQYELIKQKTGNPDPFVRMTFYNEVSDFLAQGYVQPPVASNMLWTYVAARRNHYPAADLVKHDKDVKLGYYFNFQFTSTGSHLAPAEGPWKMEDNYRYVRSKGPLTFSVVNMGNFREYWLDAYCNAKLLWSYKDYDSDQAVYDFCRQYFGDDVALEAAQIYHDFFYSYWEMKQPDFTCIDGQLMPRQYIMQDLRYSRCIGTLYGRDWNGFSENPFSSDFDGVPTPMVTNVINGMASASRRFADVQERAERLYTQIDPRRRQFFYDHCLCYIRFMSHLSDCFYHEAYAYKNASDDRPGHAQAAYRNMERARAALLANQHDIFATWYDGDSKFGLNGKVNGTKGKADAYPTALKECETLERTGSARVVSGAAYSGGKTVNGVGLGSTLTIQYNASATGVYDLLLQYASVRDARVEATANGITIGRTFQSTGNVSTTAVATVQVNLVKGDNVIVIDNSEGTCPDLDAYTIVRSAWTTTEAPVFDTIHPGHGRYVGLDYQGNNTSELFYLYNVGQQKYIRTGGATKNPDIPELVDDIDEATAQVITPLSFGEGLGVRYLISDPAWRKGWGVQGRQVVSISTNAADRTASWGTTLTPGWAFIASPTPMEGGVPVFLTYSWGEYEDGNYGVDDPTGKTYALYYGPYEQSTDQWARTARKDVADDGVYGGLYSGISQYGDNALWQVIPVGNGSIEPLSAGIIDNKRETINNNHYYNLQGMPVSAASRGVIVINGRKFIQ